MNDRAIQRERGKNLWESFLRKVDPLARGAQLMGEPALPFDRIGGLASAKEEILTYACAAESPEIYQKWGTYPPSGVLMIGAQGVGKSLLARALATRTDTQFLRVDVPRLVLDVVHSGGKVGELVAAWSRVLEEMPPLTVFFDELEFSQAQEIGSRRADLPIGPIMDFLLEIVGRTISVESHLVIGSTSHPDTLRRAFVAPNRFERVIEVNPVFPSDVVETLTIHAREAEERAGRPLFEAIDWNRVVMNTPEPAMGDWVRIVHAVLRRKARCEAGGDKVSPATTAEFRAEVDRFRQAAKRIDRPEGGNYL